MAINPEARNHLLSELGKVLSQRAVATMADYLNDDDGLVARFDQQDAALAEHGRRFDAIDRRFDAVDERFDAIDRRFDAVDERFDAVDERFDAVDRRLDTIDRRLDAVDERFDAVDERLVTIDRRLDTIDRRFDAVDERFEAVDRRFVTLEHSVEVLRHELTAAFRGELSAGFQSQNRTMLLGVLGLGVTIAGSAAGLAQVI